MWMFVVSALLVGGGSAGGELQQRFPTEEVCKQHAEEGLSLFFKYLESEGVAAEKVVAECLPADGAPEPGDPA